MSIAAEDRDNSTTHDVVHIIVYGLRNSSYSNCKFSIMRVSTEEDLEQRAR